MVLIVAVAPGSVNRTGRRIEPPGLDAAESTLGPRDAQAVTATLDVYNYV